MRSTQWHALFVFAAVALFSAILRFSLSETAGELSLERAAVELAIAPATWLVAYELVGASWAGAAALLAGTCGLHGRASGAESAAAFDAVVLALGLAAGLRAQRTDRAVDRALAVLLGVWAIARGPAGLAVLAPVALGGDEAQRWARRFTFAAATALVFALHPLRPWRLEFATLAARGAELGGEAWLTAIGAFGLGVALLRLFEPRSQALADGLLVTTALAFAATAFDAREHAAAALVPLAALWAVLGLRWTLGRLEAASESRSLQWIVGFVFVSAALLPPLGFALRHVAGR